MFRHDAAAPQVCASQDQLRCRGWFLEQLPAIQFLVDGVLPLAALAAIHGTPAAGKSFLALDMACSIATGVPWLGRILPQSVSRFHPAEPLMCNREIPLSVAAFRLGVRWSKAYQLLLTHELRARRDGRYWMVDESDVERLEAERSQPVAQPA
jgi:hypothetical protein